MTEAQLTAAFGALLALAGMLALYILGRDYRADDLRDKLFAIRDEMFLYAHDNGLLETVAHKNLRLMINSLIRYAHQISFVRLLLISAVPRVFGVYPNVPQLIREMHESIAALPPDSRAKFDGFHNHALRTIWRHVVQGSPVLWVAYVYIKYVAPAPARATGLRQRVPSVDHFESDALRTATV